MSRLDFHETEKMLDGCDRDQLLIILAAVIGWPVLPSQVDTTKRHFKAQDLARQLGALSEDDNASVLENAVRQFLRDAAKSRPEQAIAWKGLVS